MVQSERHPGMPRRAGDLLQGWLVASLLSFQLQGDDAGLPVALGHPHEHGG